jgi:hypothetical protein
MRSSSSRPGIPAVSIVNRIYSNILQRTFADIKDNNHPVVIYAAPFSGSPNAFSQRVFLDGTSDNRGHPRVAGKGPVHATRTRRRPQHQKRSKSKVNATSDDEDSSSEEDSPSSDSEDEGPASRTRSHSTTKKKIPQKAHFVESEDETSTTSAPSKHVPEDIDESPRLLKKSKTQNEPAQTGAFTSPKDNSSG